MPCPRLGVGMQSQQNMAAQSSGHGTRGFIARAANNRTAAMAGFFIRRRMGGGLSRKALTVASGGSINMFRTIAIMVAIAVAGCNSNSDVSRKHDVEAKLAQSNKWHDVSLQESANGGYTGTAVTSKGELLNVEVEQTTSSISASWKNANGRGSGGSKVSW